MKLNEAIRIKTDQLNGEADPHITEQEIQEADRLAIEAMERCEHNYLHPAQADFRHLPSEEE